MRWNLALAVTILIAPSSLLAETQQRVDILTIFDNFTASNAAAAKCFKPDEATFTKFHANYRDVIVRASLRLSKMYPNATNEKIKLVMKNRMQQLGENVVAKIENVGCDDDSIKLLVKLFKAHADWEIGK